MTLLELLVQELPKRGGWPEGAEIAASYAGDRYVCFLMMDNCPHQSYQAIETSELSEIGTTVKREQYESALAASKQVAWDGEGLPPVEMKVEWLSEIYGWIDGTVAGHDEKYPQVAIIRHNGGYAVCNRHEIRTEAERRREEAAKSMLEVIESQKHRYTENAYMLIYDAIAAGKIPGIKLAD